MTTKLEFCVTDCYGNKRPNTPIVLKRLTDGFEYMKITNSDGYVKFNCDYGEYDVIDLADGSTMNLSCAENAYFDETEDMA